MTQGRQWNRRLVTVLWLALLCWAHVGWSAPLQKGASTPTLNLEDSLGIPLVGGKLTVGESLVVSATGAVAGGQYLWILQSNSQKSCRYRAVTANGAGELPRARLWDKTGIHTCDRQEHCGDSEPGLGVCDYQEFKAAVQGAALGHGYEVVLTEPARVPGQWVELVREPIRLVKPTGPVAYFADDAGCMRSLFEDAGKVAPHLKLHFPEGSDLSWQGGQAMLVLVPEYLFRAEGTGLPDAREAGPQVFDLPTDGSAELVIPISGVKDLVGGNFRGEVYRVEEPTGVSLMAQTGNVLWSKTSGGTQTVLRRWEIVGGCGGPPPTP